MHGTGSAITANQRLTAFHYFLIIVGFVTAGYVTSLEKKLYLMQISLGLVGSLISFAFLCLDLRNTRLVDDGRNALRKLERSLGMQSGMHRMDYDRPTKSRLADLLGWIPIWGRLKSRQVDISHSYWFRTIERIALLAFALAALAGIINTARCVVGGSLFTCF